MAMAIVQIAQPAAQKFYALACFKAGQPFPGNWHKFGSLVISQIRAGEFPNSNG
jgi:hypothetical protein